MSQTEFDSAMLEQRCREEVDLLQVRHRWALLARDEFVRRAIEQLPGAGGDARRAAVAAYCLALHAACSGAEGLERQNQAYDELFRYLYDSAWRYPDVREDVAQQALEQTFRSFARCREPGAFLAFALQHLMDAVRVARRQGRNTWRLDVDDIAEQDLAPLDQHHPDPSVGVIADELRARFDRLAAEFLRRHPRAAMQLAALRLKYIDGLDEAAISRELGKSITNIYVLRSRAIEKLRAEPEWRALAAEFGIFPAEPES